MKLTNRKENPKMKFGLYQSFMTVLLLVGVMVIIYIVSLIITAEVHKISTG